MVKKFPWLSTLLCLLAFMAFGGFLHYRDSHLSVWGLAIGYAFLQTAALSVGWRPARNVLLSGFRSDVSYSIMALVAASLAVVVLSWVHTFSYFLVMIAAAILLRIDLLTRDIPNILCFLMIFSLSIMGLGFSWIPHWQGWRLLGG